MCKLSMSWLEVDSKMNWIEVHIYYGFWYDIYDILYNVPAQNIYKSTYLKGQFRGEQTVQGEQVISIGYHQGPELQKPPNIYMNSTSRTLPFLLFLTPQKLKQIYIFN